MITFIIIISVTWALYAQWKIFIQNPYLKRILDYQIKLRIPDVDFYEKERINKFVKGKV